MYNWIFSIRSQASCKHFKENNSRLYFVKMKMTFACLYIDMFTVYKLMTNKEMNAWIWPYV